VSPGANMLGRACQRGLKGCERLVGAIEIEQRGTAVVQRFDMVRRTRKDHVEIDECLGMTPKSGQYCTAVEKRIDLRGIACQHRIKTEKRFLEAIERDQRIPPI